ncbi:hypothetical protein [Caulobacter mirabilis]|uniref:Uncharacterized protein n=1 Tax=Caulobacter mirabilis TaxID=69666 RepID=A0A2D2B2N7_9CAUL|nr:hypothetical protein [Caulobacter mirabilis]ATQ44486.1 hypothetical protein CSW64_19895 [Caulobacter mirabilis]
MKPGLLPLLAGLSLAVSAAAGAQEPAPPPPAEAPLTDDPIAALIGALPPDQTTDMDAEEAAPEPAAAPLATAPATPPQPIPATMLAPPPRQDAPLAIPSLSRLPKLDRPVMIGESDRRPDAPPTAVDLAYENRIRASVQAAQGLQGPLDGNWTVRDSHGTGLYALQLVDKGYGYMLEGAWRSLAGGRVGLIDNIDRQPTSMTLRITRTPGKAPAVLTLTPRGAADWAGELTDEAGTRPVVMRRN